MKDKKTIKRRNKTVRKKEIKTRRVSRKKTRRVSRKKTRRISRKKTRRVIKKNIKKRRRNYKRIKKGGIGSIGETWAKIKKWRAHNPFCEYIIKKDCGKEKETVWTRFLPGKCCEKKKWELFDKYFMDLALFLSLDEAKETAKKLVNFLDNRQELEISDDVLLKIIQKTSLYEVKEIIQEKLKEIAPYRYLHLHLSGDEVIKINEILEISKLPPNFIKWKENSCYFDSVLVVLLCSPNKNILYNLFKTDVFESECGENYKTLRNKLYELYVAIYNPLNDSNGVSRIRDELRELYKECDTRDEEYKWWDGNTKSSSEFLQKGILGVFFYDEDFMKFNNIYKMNGTGNFFEIGKPLPHRIYNFKIEGKRIDLEQKINLTKGYIREPNNHTVNETEAFEKYEITDKCRIFCLSCEESRKEQISKGKGKTVIDYPDEFVREISYEAIDGAYIRNKLIKFKLGGIITANGTHNTCLFVKDGIKYYYDDMSGQIRELNKKNKQYVKKNSVLFIYYREEFVLDRKASELMKKFKSDFQKTRNQTKEGNGGIIRRLPFEKIFEWISDNDLLDTFKDKGFDEIMLEYSRAKETATIEADAIEAEAVAAAAQGRARP